MTQTFLYLLVVMAGLAVWFAVTAQTTTPPAVTVEPSAEKARAEVINQQLVDMGNGADPSQADWEALDAIIDGYQKQFGITPKTTHNVIWLRQRQLNVAKKDREEGRFDALLAKLAADPVPEVAAAFAKLASFKTKPIELQFTAVDGTAVNLANLRGKVVLIDFWATWCPPCRAKVPEVVAAYQKFHDRGFEIIGVSLDQNKDTLLNFTQTNNMVWPQYFDGKVWKNDISTNFEIHQIPSMWLVDKKGMLATRFGRDDLAGKVEKLLDAP